MQDFKSFSKDNDNDFYKQNGNLLNLITSLSKKFDGKSNKDLLDAIYKEALKGKQNGTLTNDDIDKFTILLTPFLDAKQVKILEKVANDIKNI